MTGEYDVGSTIEMSQELKKIIKNSQLKIMFTMEFIIEDKDHRQNVDVYIRQALQSVLGWRMQSCN